MGNTQIKKRSDLRHFKWMFKINQYSFLTCSCIIAVCKLAIIPSLLKVKKIVIASHIDVCFYIIFHNNCIVKWYSEKVPIYSQIPYWIQMSIQYKFNLWLTEASDNTDYTIDKISIFAIIYNHLFKNCLQSM